MEETLLFKRIYGCLLASAIGNGMGSPVENWAYQEIEKKYGKIESLLNPERIDLEDDNQAVLLLCKAYIEKQEPITGEDLSKTWLKEMEEPKRFFWCMRNTYELLKRGFSPRLTGMFNIVTGSAIMAIAPVGIYNACDPKRAYIDAMDIGYMYQPKLDVDCACVIAACVAEAFKPDSTVDSIISVALDMASNEPQITFDERIPNNIKDTLQKALEVAAKYNDVYKVREELYQKVLQWHPIDPVEVLTLTLSIFKVSGGDTRAAITGGVNIGRDTDTIANLCGSLSGAMNGIDSIPQEWISQVQSNTISKFRSAAQEMTRVVEKRIKETQHQIEALKRLMERLP